MWQSIGSVLCAYSTNSKNTVLNLRKRNVIFFQSEIKYLGHIINKDGRRPDPDRATAIKEMPAPDNVQALQSFIGLANFCQIFIKNMLNLKPPSSMNLLRKIKPGVGHQNAKLHLKK